jgi:hypothetical protein
MDIFFHESYFHCYLYGLIKSAINASQYWLNLHNDLQLERTIYCLNRILSVLMALYYESTAGAVQWCPVYRIELGWMSS